MPKKGPTGAESRRTIVQSRSVPWPTRLVLAVRAGGRCEFRGCNRLLLEHPLTLEQNNFGEVAHVVAFSEDGPRGRAVPRRDDVHVIENLLFLCPQCHKLIDDSPDQYPRARLEQFKAEHESRIRYLTGLAPELRTVVVQLKARINGDAVEIPLRDVTNAVAPRYPNDSQGCIIDVTGLSDERSSVGAAAREIHRRVERLYEPGMDADKVRHISLFALAPIPLLVYLGARLSNKIPVDLYQRHRDTKDWAWKQDGEPVNYAVRVRRTGSDTKKVAVVLPLSGAIQTERLPATIDQTFTVRELVLDGRDPSTDFMRRREDLTRFEFAFRELLARIVQEHPLAPEIHLFPAVPAPVAVACGHQLLPKSQPPLLVYDFVAATGGFTPVLRTDDQ